jgi:sigma-54 dependent transcriptional regulator, acetoin dehydrogenase operon transcriptional activator AcoR
MKRTPRGIVQGKAMNRRSVPARRKPVPGKTGPRSAGRLQHAMDDAARREILAALRETSGNVVHAARALGISQPSLYSRMAALGIDPAKHRR